MWSSGPAVEGERGGVQQNPKINKRGDYYLELKSKQMVLKWQWRHSNSMKYNVWNVLNIQFFILMLYELVVGLLKHC